MSDLLSAYFVNSDVKSKILFYVNGELQTLDAEAVAGTGAKYTNLLQYLRITKKLTGTKLGCGEGGCGACTVMVSTFDDATHKISHFAANACLFPVSD